MPHKTHINVITDVPLKRSKLQHQSRHSRCSLLLAALLAGGTGFGCWVCHTFQGFGGNPFLLLRFFFLIVLFLLLLVCFVLDSLPCCDGLLEQPGKGCPKQM